MIYWIYTSSLRLKLNLIIGEFGSINLKLFSTIIYFFYFNKSIHYGFLMPGCTLIFSSRSFSSIDHIYFNSAKSRLNPKKTRGDFEQNQYQIFFSYSENPKKFEHKCSQIQITFLKIADLLLNLFRVIKFHNFWSIFLVSLNYHGSNYKW